MLTAKKRFTLALSLAAFTLFSNVSLASSQPVKRTDLVYSTTSTLDSYSDFKPALEIVMNKIIRSYQSEVDKPLSINILDSDGGVSGELIKQFSSNSVYDPTISLGMHFEKSVQVNGENASACVVQYNPKGMTSLIRSYEHINVFTRKDILQYIAAHEMGHCLAYHQTSLGEYKKLSIKEHELLADKFAISFFYANNQVDSAKRVVEFNDRYSRSETHRHPEKLQHYVDYLDILFQDNEPTSLIKSALDVFYLASGQSERI